MKTQMVTQIMWGPQSWARSLSRVRDNVSYFIYMKYAFFLVIVIFSKNFLLGYQKGERLRKMGIIVDGYLALQCARSNNLMK